MFEHLTVGDNDLEIVAKEMPEVAKEIQNLMVILLPRDKKWKLVWQSEVQESDNMDILAHALLDTGAPFTIHIGPSTYIYGTIGLGWFSWGVFDLHGSSASSEIWRAI